MRFEPMKNVFAVFVLLASTVTFAGNNAPNAQAPNAEPLPDYFTQKVEPIIANRCAVCHGCTEAPCQIKFTSFQGIKRGSSKDVIIAVRGSLPPSRLKDVKTVNGWRKLNYSPIVPDQPTRDLVANRESSVMFHAISYGLSNQPGQFDPDALRPYFDKDEAVCPANVADHEQMMATHPGMGMPLGLPALNDEEYRTITTWLEQGAPGPTAATLAARETPRSPEVIHKWEAFFNRPAYRDQLVARYVFEHTAGLRYHFKESPGEFYEIVRSSTAAPQPISEIVTETAAMSTGRAAFTYRFKKVTEILVKKNHVVWDVDLGEIQRLDALFSSKPWALTKNSAMEFTGNPFHDFKAIPAEIRSRFLLTHSHFIIDQMVRGTVCVGTGATFAIRDHFWVMFLKPEADPSVQFPGLGLSHLILRDGPQWIKNEISTDFGDNNAYQDAFEQKLRLIRPAGLGLDDIWTGDGDPNARITVFRHEVIASAHKGWVGGRPLTSWVLSYSNLERLYYNLVVNFKFWGTLQHRLRTWDLMREIRLEGEELFISLLPERYRWGVHNQWTRGWARPQLEIYEQRNSGRGSLINITNLKDPVGDLLAQVGGRLGPNKTELNDSLNSYLKSGTMPMNAVGQIKSANRSFEAFEAALRLFTARRDRGFPAALPSTTYLRVTDQASGDMRVYSLITNRAFEHHQSPVGQEKVRIPKEDTLSVFPGVVGTHANLFIDLKLSDANVFLSSLYVLRSQDYEQFRKRWGLARNSESFWPFMDWLTNWHMQADPINGARLDLGQYDNGRGKL